jgi:cobalt-zinc-cadmium efflux system membrane fusion protein
MNVIHQTPAGDAGPQGASHPTHGLLPNTAPEEVEGLPTGAPPPPAPPAKRRRWLLAGAAVVAAAGVGWFVFGGGEEHGSAPATQAGAALPAGQFRLNENEVKALRVEAMVVRQFRAERVAEGRIAYNDDRSTPVFTPYNGRVVRAVARLGEDIKAGDTLFEVETTDLAGAANDLLAAVDGANKARVTLDQALREERRQGSLFAARAASQRDVEQARAAARGAEADMKSAEATRDAARDKLRVLGRPAEEIARIEQTRRVNAIVPVVAPIAGTVTQRRVGPGQWLSTGGTDPVFTLADLSTMWLVAAVREVDAPAMRLGQSVAVRVGALPDKVFAAVITTVGTGLDATTRRMTVRAEVQDPERLLKPEMFATFQIEVGETTRNVGVPLQAVIFRGSEASVWRAIDERTFELRRVTLGLRSGTTLQVLDGLAEGDRVVTGGALFIDRAARID